MFQGHWKWYHSIDRIACEFLLAFHNTHTPILYHFEIKRNISRKLRFFISHMYSTPRRGWPRRNFAKIFSIEMIGLINAEKSMMTRKAALMQYRNGSDGQTRDRRTDRIALSNTRYAVPCVKMNDSKVAACALELFTVQRTHLW